MTKRYKIFNLSKAGRPWLPILISHLLNMAFLALIGTPFFTPEVLWFRFHFFFLRKLYYLQKRETVVSLLEIFL